MEDFLRLTPIWNIFVLFLIIAANYIGELFPCRIQNLLNSNIYLKHVIAFLTLLFFVVITDSTYNYKANETFIISIKLYIIFIILVKNNREFFLFNLFILGLVYIMKLKLKDYENNIDDDNDLLYKRLKIVEKIIFYLFFVVLITGFLIYMGEKKIEYKDKFRYNIFIFGKPSCKGKSPDTKLVESFVAAFK